MPPMAWARSAFPPRNAGLSASSRRYAAIPADRTIATAPMASPSIMSSTRTMRDAAAMLDWTGYPEDDAPYAPVPKERLYTDELATPPGKLRIAFTTEVPRETRPHPDVQSGVRCHGEAARRTRPHHDRSAEARRSTGASSTRRKAPSPPPSSRPPSSDWTKFSAANRPKTISNRWPGRAIWRANPSAACRRRAACRPCA